MSAAAKKILILFGICAGLFVLLPAGVRYVTEYRCTDVDTLVSPDGRCVLKLQMIGEPEKKM